MATISVTLDLDVVYDRPNKRYITTAKATGPDKKPVNSVKRGIGDNKKSSVLNFITTGGLVAPANSVVRSILNKES